MRLRFKLGIVENGKDEYVRQLHSQRRAELEKLENLHQRAQSDERRVQIRNEMALVERRYEKLLHDTALSPF